MMTNRPQALRRAALTLSMACLLVGHGSTSASATAETAKTTLRWKFTKGESYQYRMKQNTESTGQDPEGREMKQSVELIMDMTWIVKEVDGSGVASVTQTIDRIQTTATLPFGKVTYDSKDAASTTSPAGPLFKMLVGAEFTCNLSPIGKATDIKLSEKLLATLRSNNEPAGAQGQFSEAGLKNIIEQLVVPLKPEAVDVGETWTNTVNIPSGPEGQTRKIVQTFTSKGTEPTSKLDLVEFSTAFEAIKPDPNVPVKFKKETAIGRFEFDNAKGRLTTSKVNEDVEYSVEFQGKNLAQKVETSRLLELVTYKAP